MAYMPYPLQSSNFLLTNTTARPSPPKAIAQTMYGGRSPVEEPDNVILHEPWEMPSSAGPNHCAPGGSILLNSEEDTQRRGRRFSLLGRPRRNSRSSSISSSSGTKSGRRSVSEGLSGGKLANLFESNPFSFDSQPPTRAADIKTEPTKTSQDGRSTPSLENKPRECSLRFGELPHRPPELRRANSISIGVLSRSGMLSEQRGGAAPPRQAPNSNIRPIIQSTEPEPVDVGEVVKSGAKHVWRNLRSSFSGTSGPPHLESSRRASSSSASSTSTSPSPKSLPSIQTASPHSSSSPMSTPTSKTSLSPAPAPPPAPSAELSVAAPGLPAVTEEPGSGAATPRYGQGGSSLGLEQLNLVGSELDAAAAAGPRDSGKPPTSSSQDTPSEADIQHPDAAKRPPSPPPRITDREGIEEEAEEDELYGTPPDSTPEIHAQRRRSASFGGDGAGVSGHGVSVERAERESRGETRSSAVLGFQR